MIQLDQAKTNTFPLLISNETLNQVYGYAVNSTGSVDQAASVQGLHLLLKRLGDEVFDQIGSQIIIDYPQSKKHPVKFFYLRMRLPLEVLDKPQQVEFMQHKQRCRGAVTIKFALDFKKTGNQYEACRLINLVLRDAIEKLDYFNINYRYFDISTLKRVRTTFKNRPFIIGWLQGMKIGAVVFGNRLNLQILPVNTRFQCKSISYFLKEDPRNERFLRNLTVITLHNGMQYKITGVDRSVNVDHLMSKEHPDAGTYLNCFAKQEEKINEVYERVLGISGIFNLLRDDKYMLKAVAADKIKKGRIRKSCMLPPQLCIIMNDPLNSPAFGLSREVREENEIDPIALFERVYRMLKLVKEDQMVQDVFYNYQIYIAEQDDCAVYKLQPPTLSFNDGYHVVRADQRDRSRIPPCYSLIYRAASGKLTGGLLNWGIITGDKRAGSMLAYELEYRFRSMCSVQQYYNQFEPPLLELVEMNGRDQSDNAIIDYVYEAMHRLYNRLKCAGANEVYVFIVILPGGNKQECMKLYKGIKSRAFQSQIMTQCILYANVQKPKVIDAISQQIYAKCGGAVWSPTISDDFYETMCCALDVSRPRVQTYSREQVRASTGFVSTYFGMEHVFSQARNVHRENQAGEVQSGREIADYIDAALKYYYFFRDRRILPQKIVFYRDGVADGQMRDVTMNECQSIIRILQQRIVPQRPQIEFYMIIAQKAPPMRICGVEAVSGAFVCDSSNSFYLASAFSPTGATPRPVRYFILSHCIITADAATDVQETRESFESIITFTNSLAYGYVNCDNPIATPHILHLAHHLSRYTNEVLDGQESVGASTLMGMNMRPYFI